jgi:hypothetical protein
MLPTGLNTPNIISRPTIRQVDFTLPLLYRNVMTDHELSSAEAPVPYTPEDTFWNGNQILADEALVERNLAAMQLLLAAGGVPEEFIDTDYATNLPQTYDFDGTKVEFLPDWGYYKLGELNRTIPKNDKTIQADLFIARWIAEQRLLEK